MGFLNQFTAIGRPISDIAFGYTKESNVPYAYFMFAIPSYTVIKDANPTLLNRDDIIQCRAFNKEAVIMGKYGTKGEMMCLTGEIKNDYVSNKHYFWVKEIFFLKNYFKQKGADGRRFYRRYNENGELINVYVDENDNVVDVESGEVSKRYKEVMEEKKKKYIKKKEGGRNGTT